MRDGTARYHADVRFALRVLLVVFALAACALACSSGPPVAAAMGAEISSATQPALMQRTAAPDSAMAVAMMATSAAPVLGTSDQLASSTAAKASGLCSCCIGPAGSYTTLTGAAPSPTVDTADHPNASTPTPRIAPCAGNRVAEPVPISLSELSLLRI